MITPVQHTDGTTVLLDTSEGVYYRFPDAIAHNLAQQDTIIMNGRYFAYFDTVQGFLDSDNFRAIVPVYCIERKNDNKRFFVTFYSGHTQHKFHNVERIDNKWESNEIEIVHPKKAYFVYLNREKHVNSGCIIKGIKEIKKPGTK